MRTTGRSPWAALAATLVAVALLGWPVSPAAQTPQPKAGPNGAPAPAAQPSTPAAAPASEPAPPAAQPQAAPLPPDVSEGISRQVSAIEKAEASLARMKDVGEDIGRLRDEVEQVITDSTTLADSLRPRLTQVKSQIDRLGPPPAKDAPAEPPAAAAERARLNAEAAALEGAIKTLEVTWVRARQTIDNITDLRLAMFTRSLTERMSSPLLPGLWSDVLRDAPQVARQVSYITTDWWDTVTRKGGPVALLVIAALGVYAALRLLAARLTRFGPATRSSFFGRAAAAAWNAPFYALPGIAAALIVQGGLDALGLLYYPSDRITRAVVWAVIVFSAVTALIAAVLAPKAPEGRLVPLADHSARRVSLFLQAMTAVYVADVALGHVGRVLYLPLSWSVMHSVLATLAFAGLMIGLLLTPFAPQGVSTETRVPRDRPRWLKVPLWIAVLGILAALGLGYVALARFLSQQILLTGAVAALAALGFLAIRAFTREPEDSEHAVGRLLSQRFGLDPPRRRQFAWLTELLLTLLLALIVLPLLLLQWGFSGADVRDMLKSAFFGFEIGQFRISLARILLGVVLFAALLFVTRLIQRWLRDSVLAPQRLDPGIANSIDTAVGYAGIGIAALIAISYAGFDVTNLAIVAGALSVGIGFGLQSIVNNFVSGLILLVERPIKVGDWIVIGSEQGNVRRISVRSTEIETFDKASLIVPNSDLITGRVLNWTHRSSVGRVIIKVTVGLGADPRRVLDILTECGKSHQQVMAFPAPKAVFEGFGTGGLDFSLRVHLADINSALDAQSGLRLAIYEALKAANVPITPPPAPQFVVPVPVKPAEA